MLWLLGCVIYVLMMATAFMGYVLPWGQMSFWGAKVITNLIGALPVVGSADHHSAVGRLFGRRADAEPLLLAALSAAVHDRGGGRLHIWALHVPGNNNPTGVNLKSTSDTVPFSPYYTVKDAFAIGAVRDHVRGVRVLSCLKRSARPTTSFRPIRW